MTQNMILGETEDEEIANAYFCAYLLNVKDEERTQNVGQENKVYRTGMCALVCGLAGVRSECAL